MDIAKAKEKVLSGALLDTEELLVLAEAGSCKNGLDELMRAADEIRAYFCGNGFELCTIINGRSGKCSEDCKYCAQSIYYKTKVETYDLLSAEEVMSAADSNEKAGVNRFSIVTSGKTIEGKDLECLCDRYRELSAKSRMGLCASHGLLDFSAFRCLKEAGVSRYHNNLETSRRYFPQVCTTHTYDQKITAIKAARQAGLEVCSGGILGMGETMEDRIDMALTLRELKVDSVPLNILNPIPGTPFMSLQPLSYDEICRSAALFRFALPRQQIRLAGGRSLMPDKGRRVMKGGINAIISGDMLTTAGINTRDDLDMVKQLGYEVII